MTDETMKMLDELLQKQINILDEIPSDEAKRSRAMQDLTKLLEQMTNAEVANAKWYDDQERREIERDKNRAMVQIEEERSKMGFGRSIIEIGKFAVPAAVSLITLRKWGIKFDNMLAFEKDGTLKTSASREVRLPRLKI